MADHPSSGAGDFDAMARQYWNLWGDALRQWGGAAPAPAWPQPGWPQALDWWSKLVPGMAPSTEEVMHRFRHQSGDWFGLMQQLAARFAGTDTPAADIAQGWKQMLGVDAGQGPWRDFLRGLQGGGAGGFDGWYAQLRPYLDNLQRESERWLHLPTFGPAREHQERWQALAQAQQDYQRSFAEYEQLMLRVMQRALERFEALLAARAEPGQQITSARALFDLWIDAAEQAYGEVALSPEFRRVYGALTNAQMRLRLAVTREIEQVCQMFGMPTRTEVDAAHRKIAELERRLRQSERQAARAQAAGATPQREAQPAPPRRSPAKAATTAADTPAKAAAPARSRKAAAAQPATKSAPANAPPAKRAHAAARAQAPARKRAKPAAPAAAAPARKASGSKATAARKPSKSAPVVSMKDWVARYADEPQGKKRSRT